MDNTNFIDQEGHIIKTSSMKDEHQLIKITEKTPMLQNIGKIVRGDTNSNIITFEINRYYDNVDLYKKNIRFIVKNGDDIFIENAVNLQYNTELLRFSWILSRLVTYKVGTIIAAIEFYSEIDLKCNYSLKTIPFEIKIENSLDVSDVNSIEENSEINISPVPIASVAKNNNISIFTVTDKNGTTTAEILDGKDGITPHINPETKHWFIDEEDTGISAEGADGITPVINASDKHWHIGGVDTGIVAEGQDGVTPHIDTATKHWFIGNTDTGIIAEGKDGLQGDPGQNGTTYTPTIGTVTSLAYNQNATSSVSIDEDNKTVAFNFGIPKGENGNDGFSTTITENENNTEDNYKLDITNKNNTFTTPNLMGVIGMEYKNMSAGTPVGEIISYMGTTAPANYLICNGAVYNIADYPYLTQHFLDNFGAKNFFGGNGTTTFAVPDLRGEFLRGSGTNSHINTDINLSQGSGANVGVHQNASALPGLIAYKASGNSGGVVADFQDATTRGQGVESPDSQLVKETRLSATVTTTTTTQANNTRPWIYTTRPTNTSVLYCIKYKPTYWITPTNNTDKE